MKFIRKLFRLPSNNNKKVEAKSVENIPRGFCPYCGSEFETYPTRKRKCPGCNETVFLIKKDGDSIKSIVTEELYHEISAENNRIKEERAAEKLRIRVANKEAKMWLEIIERQLDIKQQIKLLKIKEPIPLSKFENYPVGSKKLIDEMFRSNNGIIHQVMIKHSKGQAYYGAYRDLYEQQSRILDFEGKKEDSHRMMAESRHWNALANIGEAIEDGAMLKFIIRAHIDENTCPTCRELDKTIYSLEEWKQQKPLTNHLCENDWCRCGVLPIKNLDHPYYK